MPAPLASSVTVGFSMPDSSHITNECARHEVRTFLADIYRQISHTPNMARRGFPKGQINWFLREWMEASGLRGRGAQAKMMELTGWSKATMSQLFNGTQDYSPKVVNDAARALNTEPFELLMLPERAMAMRRWREDAIRIAAESSASQVVSSDAMSQKDGTNG